MRNRDSKKLITSLLAATVAGFFALSVMPEIQCETGQCVKSPGSICYKGGRFHIGYKLQMTHDA